MNIKLYALALLLALSAAVFAQNAPVTTTTTVLPPYSIHMLENLRSDRDKFIVTITLRDLTQTDGQVRLRLRMESFTHAMQTRRGAATPVYTLTPGVPLRLTNEDLRVYFLEQNLEFTNMPQQLYRNNATVPEGRYRIWFEVYEARTGVHVSRGSEVAAHVHIVQHDVPLINLPQQNATIHLPESGLQHVVFQWAPRHHGPGMLTEYKLQIVEVPPGMNPEQVMQATLVPFFETTTMATSFVFNHAHPPLRLGFTYAYRVQARLRGPDEGMSMFKNNGYTPTQWFTFSQRCPEVRNVRVEPINQFSVWVHYMDHPLYERVRFRRRLDQAGSFWHYVGSDQNPMLVTELRPEQGYQYQMMAYCAFEHSNWTAIRTFTTPPALPPLFECGAIDATPPLVNTGVPLGRPLRRGDVVRLPQNSELRIMESSGTGPYRGYGTVFFNFFNANLIMTFQDLQVDDAMQWISGELISRSSSDGRFTLDLDRIIEGGGGVGRVITGETTTQHQTGNDLSGNSTATYNPNTGTLTIRTEDGTTVTIPNVESLPTTITDGNGTLFVVNEQGQITEVGQRQSHSDNPPRTMQPTTTGTVTFARAEESRFPFDEWNEVYATSLLISAVYEDMNGYRPPFKAIPQGESDKVIATMNLRDSRINPDSVRFITPQGVSFTPRRISENTFELTLLGGRENDAQEVFAVYELDGEMVTLGKINVVTYRPKTPRVVLVPVNGATIDADAVARMLDEIYGPLGISWQVDKAENFEFDGDMDFFERRSGLFAAYTPAMRLFQSVFLETLGDDFDSEAAYLFIFDEENNDRDQSGFMPRGEQMGYIFSRGMDARTLGIIIAHELGHGMFQLRHTFDNAYGLAQNALPHNLMDYSLGTHLAKWQWDLMFAPGIVMRVFERDEDAMAIINRDAQIVRQAIEALRFGYAFNRTVTFNLGASPGVRARNIVLGDNNLYEQIIVRSNQNRPTINPQSAGFDDRGRTADNRMRLRFDSDSILLHVEVETSMRNSQHLSLKDYILCQSREAWLAGIDNMIVAGRFLSLSALPDEALLEISNEQRIRLLNRIANNQGRDFDLLAVRVMENVPKDQVSDLFSRLSRSNTFELLKGSMSNNPSIYNDFMIASVIAYLKQDDIDDRRTKASERETFIWRRSYGATSTNVRGGYTLAESGVHNSLSIVNGNSLRIRGSIDILRYRHTTDQIDGVVGSVQLYDETVNMTDLIRVRIVTDLAPFERGNVVYIPAFYFDWLVTDFHRRQQDRVISAAVNLAVLVAVPFSEFRYAATALRLVFAASRTVTVVNSTINLVRLNDEINRALINNDRANDFLAVWNNISFAHNIVTLISYDRSVFNALVFAFNTHRQFLRENLTIELFDELRELIEEIENNKQ
ncbi:MAG: hypothetical protein FWD02_04230 [Bacteroidales bacterium]|nr:hypothetical protein [Bacteroidales bacterium]